MIELKVRLGSKGQVVIPKILRETYKIYPKQEIIITAEPGGVLIAKKKEDPIKIMEKIAEIATKKRNGKPFVYNKEEFYEQYDKRAKRAGL